jgi:hypothetical protein
MAEVVVCREGGVGEKVGRRYSRRPDGHSPGICAWVLEQWQRAVVVQSGLRRGRDKREAGQG